jgi:chromosome segregation ATPase
MSFTSWFSSNWNSVLTTVAAALGTAVGFVWKASGRVTSLENRIAGLENQQTTLRRDLEQRQKETEERLLELLKNIERRVQELDSLRELVARNDERLGGIAGDIRELRTDVKALMLRKE